MVAYQLASKQPSACLEQDGKQQTPIQLAAAADKGEVLNAMLLACAGHATDAALSATRALLAAGAVCDTWAPNGSSALMLAASVDCAEGVGLLLDHAASLELQDALGRWGGVGRCRQGGVATCCPGTAWACNRHANCQQVLRHAKRLQHHNQQPATLPPSLAQDGAHVCGGQQRAGGAGGAAGPRSLRLHPRQVGLAALSGTCGSLVARLRRWCAVAEPPCRCAPSYLPLTICVQMFAHPPTPGAAAM